MADISLCSIDDCNKPAKKRGWCNMHYGRWLRHRDVHRTRPGRNICTVDGCADYVFGHGYCSTHYQRWKRNSDPLGGRVRNGEPLAWLTKAIVTVGDNCLLWPFAKNRSGYGVVNIDGRNRIVSRFVCETTSGPPPYPDADTAHSCNNPPCCNPGHVRWDTRTGNMADAIQRGTTLRGKRHPNVKLTEDAVRIIRSMAGIDTQENVAAQFSVSISLVSAVQNNRRWGWVS